MAMTVHSDKLRASWGWMALFAVISLIGGGGLGQEILEALQYAAKGPGLLGGFAILFLAMVMDRIVQGAFRRADQK